MENDAKRRKKARPKRPRRRSRQTAKAPSSHEDMIRALLDASHERALLMESDGTILALNRNAAQSFGMEVGEAVGRCVYDLMPVEFVAARRKSVRKALGRGESVEYEDERDGRWMAARIHPLRDDRGEATRVAVFATDITERRLAQQEQEASLELLRLLNAAGTTRELLRSVLGFFRNQSACEAVGIRLQSGDDFPYYVTTGFAGDFIQAENSLCSYDEAGQLVRDSKGRPFLECMCGNVLQGRVNPSLPFFTRFGSFWTNSTTDLLARTTEADRQGPSRDRCNTAGYESLALIPLRMTGQTLGLLQLNGTRRDRFTPEAIARYERLAGHVAIAVAHRLAKTALQQNDLRFQAILDSLHDAAITVFDRDGKFLFAFGSPEFEAQIGKSGADLVGGHVADILEPEAAGPLLDAIRRVYERGLPERLEVKVAHPTSPAGICWHEVSLSPMRATGKEVTAVVGFVHDVTQRRESENRLLAYQKRLQQMAADLVSAEDTERRRIAGDLHDDVGQALAVAKMKVDLARKSPPCKNCVAFLQEIADLIQEAACGTGAALFNLYPPALYELGLEAATERLTQKMQEKYPDLRLAFETDGQPKPLSHSVRGALFRATRELLLNAVRHAQAKKVRVSMGREGDNLRISVEDNGRGFDPDPVFKQAGAVSGFGLFNIRERMEYLGGRLEIDSRPGRGTLASLTLLLGGE